MKKSLVNYIKELELTTSEYTVLSLLVEMEGSSMKHQEISDEIGLSKNTMTKIINSLKKKGLIEVVKHNLLIGKTYSLAGLYNRIGETK